MHADSLMCTAVTAEGTYDAPKLVDFFLRSTQQWSGARIDEEVVSLRLMYSFIVFCMELLCVSIPFWLKDFHLCVYIFRFCLLSQQFSFGHL